MRSATSFTLHAILAACLAALAASSAAAGKPVIDNEGHVFLSGAIFGAHGSSQGGQLEVQSYQWGALPAGSDPKSFGNWIADVERPAARGGGQNELGMDDTAGKERTPAGRGRASGEMVMKGSNIGENSHLGRGVDIARVDGEQVAGQGTAGRITAIASDPAEPSGARTGHSMLGAADRITVGGAHTESGQATGKRQHKPLVARGYYDQSTPPERGSLTVLASGASCRLGARYPSLSLSGRGKTYLLQDVRVVDCSSTASGPDEQITFVYGNIGH